VCWCRSGVCASGLRNAEGIFRTGSALFPRSLMRVSLPEQRVQRDMNEHEEIAKALKTRLSELRTHLAKVDRSLRKPLPADSEDQAIELENQEALEVIKKTETTEIHQIDAALKRISEGTYGTCAKCGEPIDPRRLKALPTAPTCISCSA
jgi:DnaK suppressor protein